MPDDVPDDVLWCTDLVTELAGCLEVIERATLGTSAVDETSLDQVSVVTLDGAELPVDGLGADATAKLIIVPVTYTLFLEGLLLANGLDEGTVIRSVQRPLGWSLGFGTILGMPHGAESEYRKHSQLNQRTPVSH